MPCFFINKEKRRAIRANLHKLSEDKPGQLAVNVSGNWRIFFEFIDGDAYIVDYDDSH